MSGLQLTIPAQAGDSRGNRIKPREVREWLDNLPCLDMQRATTLVNEQLRLMNRQTLAPAARLEILGEFLRSYFRLLESIPASPSEAAQVQALLKRLSQNIGFGYKIVVHELANGKAGLLDARHLPAALLGAVHALGLQLLHYYSAFQRAPQALWNECLAIYRYASLKGRESWQGALPGVGTIGIDESFRLTALLRLADPYRLPDGAARALESYFRARIGLTAMATDATESDLLLPLLRDRKADSGAEADPLYLDPAALMQRMAADISKLEQYKSLRALELPDLVPAPLLQQALQRVLRHWASDPAKRAAREEAAVRVELAVGLEAAYCVVNKGRPFDPGLFVERASHEEIDIGCRPSPEAPAPARPPETLSCTSIDRSDGGLSVSYRGRTSVKPYAGQVLALRRAAPSGAAWVIAVCRWLVESESGAGFEMGLQYLARQPEAVVIRASTASGEHRPAIAASRKHGDQEVRSLIAPASQLKVGDEFTLYARNGRHRARCGRLVETTHSFDRLIYEPLA